MITAVVAPMRNTASRSLGDVRFVDADAVGGKAASLGELIAAGMRVTVDGSTGNVEPA